MKIYVAGPMRGKPEFNFPAFDAATHLMEQQGHRVFSPAGRDRQEAGFDTREMTGEEDLAKYGFDLRFALHSDTAWISLHADAVAVLHGWEFSSGARAEVALAHALGLPVAPWRAFGGNDILPGALIKPGLPPSGTTFDEGGTL